MSFTRPQQRVEQPTVHGISKQAWKGVETLLEPYQRALSKIYAQCVPEAKTSLRPCIHTRVYTRENTSFGLLYINLEVGLLIESTALDGIMG